VSQSNCDIHFETELLYMHFKTDFKIVFEYNKLIYAKALEQSNLVYMYN
jgi:N-dimethylarginine dimethylaminohydrolase